MNWAELFERANASAGRSAWLLDRALDAVNAAQNNALDAAIAAELPTARLLCAMMDEHGLSVPPEVLSRFHGYLAPSPVRASLSSNLRWERPEEAT